MVKKKNYYKKYGTLYSGESNPFNVKVNRKKHAVLGADVKGTKGQPVISKGLNYTKRKEFLKKNSVAAHKSNTYVDKRAKNSSVSLNDQVTARFMHEKQNKSKNNVFNLSGQKQNSKTFSNDDEDDNEEKDVSFKNSDSFDASKSHKEIIEEMIADSKQKKMERKMEKEKYLNSLEQVDNAWKKLFTSSKLNPPVSTSKILTKEPRDSNTKDPYDVSRNELKFEQRCSSISHTRSAEEIKKEEEKKYIQLEKDKLSRMKDNHELDNFLTSNHISADAICDEYEYLQPIKTEYKHETSDRNYDSGEESDSSQSSFEEIDHQQENNFDSEDKMFEDYDFMPDIPNNLNDFKARIENCNAEKLTEVLENILKKYAKSKNEKVLTKLENFFEILLRYAFECCNKKIPDFELIGALPPYLHLLANAVNIGTAHRLLNLMNEEQDIFNTSKQRVMKKNFPRLQTIVILQFVVAIYSTSDFRHPVVTPAMVFMCDILGSSFSSTFNNILCRLFISELILKCISDSKRFVPEAIHFLNNVLQLADPANLKAKKNMPRSKLFHLIITDNVSSEDVPSLDLFVSNKNMTDENKKIGVIFTVVNQLLHFATLYSQLPSFKEIFAPVITVCAELPTQFYPVSLKMQIKKLVELGKKSVPLHPLEFQKVKPKPLKMFEPRFECKFNKRDDLSKKRKLIKKVTQKIKKEEKSMLREIRRDAQVVAAEKLKEKLELDAERKRKVKEIYGSLSVQEGEFKKIMKKKS